MATLAERHSPLRAILNLAPLAAILALAALLRLWNISANEYGRQYYAAAVLSMMEDGRNFLFNAFDPAGFVSLDKPPVAIWMQVLSAKLLGFSAFAVLLPQVIEGLVAVGLVYLLVNRSFGRAAGLIAALALAVTPISVAVDRSNNTESCLIVVLLLAVWAGMRAAETKRLALLCLSMALIGVGFNVKMGAALALVPTLGLAFLLAGPATLRRWSIEPAAAGAVLIAASLAWVAVFDLTPPQHRPYAGSTTGNSMAELTLLHNGVARFIRPFERTAVVAAPVFDGNDTADAPRPRLWDDSPTGPWRLLRAHQASQMAWLLPVALAGLWFGWRGSPGSDAGRSRRIAIGVWAGWLATYWTLFSFAGGPFHTYYLAALAPPLAALTGIAASEMWKAAKEPGRAGLALPLVLVAAIAWQCAIAMPQITLGADNPLTWLLTASMAVAALGATLFAFSLSRPLQPAHASTAAALSFAGLAALPLACALSVVLIRPNIAAPAASLAAYSEPQRPLRAAGRERLAASRDKLLGFLRQQRSGERFLLAVPNAIIAAPLIIASGAPVMAMGGYAGVDPILTPEDLTRRAREGQLRFVMLGGFRFSPAQDVRQRALAEWVRANGTRIDETQWSTLPRSRSDTYRIRLGGQLVTLMRPQLYDLAKASAGQ